MDLSSLNKQVVFDPIRDCWVRATPEEQVRQLWIRRLIGPLGFPKGLLAVEKQVRALPHLTETVSLPDRRLDLLCYAKGIHPLHSLYPLLLIECKVEKLTREGINQLIGYNHHVQAPFIAIVNREEVLFVYQQAGACQFGSFLPPFKELIAWVT